MCRKKPFALLLAVVADVDVRLGLFAYNAAQRRPPERFQLGRIDRFTARPANMKLGQLGWSRQAPGVGCQYPFFAAAHRRSFPQLSGNFLQSSAKAAGRHGAIANNLLAAGEPTS